MSSNVIDVTMENFKDEINTPLPVVLDFGAEWCGPCKRIVPIIKAVANEDYRTIESLISENYSDSYHNSKESLMADCRQQLSQNLVEKSKKTGQLITISGPKAKVVVFLLITFAKDSYVSQNFVSFLQMKAEINLQKQTNNKWLINRIEIREINRQPTGWNQIR